MMLKRYLCIALVLTIPGLAASASASEQETCRDLKTRLQFASDHVNDPLDWVASGNTDAGTIGARLRQQDEQSTHVLADINSAMDKGQISADCEEALKRAVLDYQNRKRNVSMLLKEQFSAFTH